MEKYKNKYRIESHRKPNWDYSADALYFLTVVTQNRECNLGKIVTVDAHGVFPVETHGRIETHNRVETHGRVSLREQRKQTCEMILSDFGKIVNNEWLKSFEIRKELFLHEFIIMPNHIHAIVEIYNPKKANNNIDNNTCNDDMDDHARNSDMDDHARRDTRPCVSTTYESTPTDSIILNSSINDLNNRIKRNPPIRLPKSISSFMAGFKSSVNTRIDDYIDDHKLSIPKYNRNNHFFQPNYHDHIIRNQQEYHIIQNYIISNPLNWANDVFYGKDTK